MKKIWKRTLRFLCSMQCAISLLVILALACTAGSFIPQGEQMIYYTEHYSEQLTGAILLFGLDDVFHSVWFILLTLLLCANLLCCNVLRFWGLLRKTRTGFTAEKAVSAWDGNAICTVSSAEEMFRKMGFRKVETYLSGGLEYRYAVRNKAGLWGAWLCHLGMLVIIAGFGLGQMYKTEYTVYGVPGQTKSVGDSGYDLTINDFEVKLREDDTVEQYTADFTVTDTDSGESRSAKTSVNAPASAFGMKYYQNSTGWATQVAVRRGEEILDERLLCAGEYMETPGKEDLKLMFRAFYPDYTEDAAGNPMTRSSTLKNPAYLYTLYYNGQVLGMNVLPDGEEITVDDYTFVFHDPQLYTLIQVKKDPFTLLAMLGGILVLISLILSFYVRTEELWAVKSENGSWNVAGKSRKGGAIYREKIGLAGSELNKREVHV